VSPRTVPLRHLAEVRVSNVDKKSVDGETSVRLCNYTDVYYGDRITADMNFMPATATRQQIQAFGLKAGDSLIRGSGLRAGRLAWRRLRLSSCPHTAPKRGLGSGLSGVGAALGLHA
jgi:hypothetical protein